MKDRKNNTSGAICRCLALLVVGFVISFNAVTVYATETTGSTSTFWYGLKKYSKYAMLTTSSTYIHGTTNLTCKSGTCDSGYLGVSSNVYRETSSGSGTYYLVTAGAWAYNSSAASSLTTFSSTVEIPSSGYYMSQGKTAVYYDGAYQYNYTNVTPFIQIT